MSYLLGVDVGTTYTAAAVWREGSSYMLTLGVRSPEMPTVVARLDDGGSLIGEAAERRALLEPDRVAREFKRRLGDSVPVLLAGAPHSAESLMAEVLRHVVERATSAEGSPPTAVAVTHPANWGPYKNELLGQALQLAGLSGASTLSEPEAAAEHYASQTRVDVGSVLAVYDLGGGTFDAAVLAKRDDDFVRLGESKGLERLGGIDFDAAVLDHVTRAVEVRLDRLPDDPPTRTAVARLRAECVGAKEALSNDTAAVVPVMIPPLHTDVRLTRGEFERMIKPALVDSVRTLRTTIEEAGIDPTDLRAVLLVGGSSRIPLVSQMVNSSLGVPVQVDAHPKHSIALGAALHAASRAERSAADILTPAGPPGPPPPADVTPEVTPVVTPEVTPVATPEVTPVVTPAATGAARQDDDVVPEAHRASREDTAAAPAGSGEDPTPRRGAKVAVPIVLAVAAAGALVAALVLAGGDSSPVPGPSDTAERPETDPDEAGAVPGSEAGSADATGDESVIGGSSDPSAASVDDDGNDQAAGSTESAGESGLGLLGPGLTRTASEFGGIGHTYSPPSSGPTSAPAFAWLSDFEATSVPVISDGVFFAGADDKTIGAYDLATGTPMWTDEVFFDTHFTVVAGGLLFFADRGQLVVLDAASGSMLAAFDPPPGLADSAGAEAPLIVDGVIHIPWVDRLEEGWRVTLQAVDARTGAELWIDQNTTDSVLHTLAFDDGVVVVGQGRSVRALRADTGEELWRFEVESTAPQHTPVIDGVVIVRDGRVRGLDLRTGEQLWTHAELGGSLMAARDGILYRASTEVYAIDIESGEELWSTRLRSGLFGRDNAIVAGDILFELASEGTVVALEAATGSPLFEVAVDTAEFASVDTAAVGDGYLLVLDEQRRIHAFA